MAKAKPKLEKLSVNLFRRGEVRYEIAYYAHDAAKLATKWARKGWQAEVQAWGSLGTKRNVFMSCGPASATKRPGHREIAACSITPAFKKRITRRR